MGVRSSPAPAGGSADREDHRRSGLRDHRHDQRYHRDRATSLLLDSSACARLRLVARLWYILALLLPFFAMEAVQFLTSSSTAAPLTDPAGAESVLPRGRMAFLFGAGGPAFWRAGQLLHPRQPVTPTATWRRLYAMITVSTEVVHGKRKVSMDNAKTQNT